MLYKFWRKENTYPCVIYGINVGEELVKFVNSKENDKIIDVFKSSEKIYYKILKYQDRNVKLKQAYYDIFFEEANSETHVLNKEEFNFLNSFIFVKSDSKFEKNFDDIGWWRTLNFFTNILNKRTYVNFDTLSLIDNCMFAFFRYASLKTYKVVEYLVEKNIIYTDVETYSTVVFGSSKFNRELIQSLANIKDKDGNLIKDVIKKMSIEEAINNKCFNFYYKYVLDRNLTLEEYKYVFENLPILNKIKENFDTVAKPFLSNKVLWEAGPNSSWVTMIDYANSDFLINCGIYPKNEVGRVMFCGDLAVVNDVIVSYAKKIDGDISKKEYKELLKFVLVLLRSGDRRLVKYYIDSGDPFLQSIAEQNYKE